VGTIPPTGELFTKQSLVERHPTILNISRVHWAVRNRHTNGLESGVFESRGSEVLIHEPTFLRWFLGLAGRAKPRAARRKRRAKAVADGR
jgi:hypothetical protein